MTETVEREVGRARPRKEDAHLITGQTNWTDNISVNGLLHFALLRSPMAHARIERVDVSPALERPGVIAAFSGADLAEGLGSMPCVWPVTEDIVMPDHPPIAVDEVRASGRARPRAARNAWRDIPGTTTSVITRWIGPGWRSTSASPSSVSAATSAV